MYPENLARGIDDPNKINKDGCVSASVFYIDQVNSARNDKYCEKSINWIDDQLAIDFLKDDSKDNGNKRYSHIAILSLADIKALQKKPLIRGKLSYERARIIGNDFHGNLLLENGLHKKTVQQIGSYIAICVQKVLDNI